MEGTALAGVAGMKKQAAAAQAAAGFFKWPGKTEREGQNFETEFRLKYNQHANLILVSDPILISGHMVPVRWQEKWGNAEYKFMRCTRYALRNTAEGYEAVERKGGHRCLYCEDPTFGSDPKGYYLLMAFTDQVYQRRNGNAIGPRLVFLQLTDRDQSILQVLVDNMARYGVKRKSKQFPNGTLVGMKYRISRGSDQRSRSIGDSLILLRDENDRPMSVSPDKLAQSIEAGIKAGKYQRVSIEKAYPYASTDEQKMVLRNAHSLNDKYQFVKEAISDSSGSNTSILDTGGTADGPDIEVDDLLGMGGNDSTDLSNLSETLKNKRGASEDDEEEDYDTFDDDEEDGDEEIEETDVEPDEDEVGEEEEEEEESGEDEGDFVEEDDESELEDDEDGEDDEEDEEDGNDTSDAAEEVAPHMKDHGETFDYIEADEEEEEEEEKPAKKKKKTTKKSTTKKSTTKKSAKKKSAKKK